MAANSSSVNTANIITALGNAFKDPSGAALPNERLAAVLIQNMNQLNDLAKQGKLNQQQIMQVRSRSHLMLNHIQCLPTGRIEFFFFYTTSYGIMQTSTNPRRQSRCVDLGLPRVPKHPIPITYILTTWHGMVNTVALSFLPFLDSTYPSPSLSHLSAEDDDGKLDSHVRRERGHHIPYQLDIEPNEYSPSRMAIFSRGTTNAHGWYVNRSNSRYVAFFERGFYHQPRNH
jgi:hypothetical protein